MTNFDMDLLIASFPSLLLLEKYNKYLYLYLYHM